MLLCSACSSKKEKYVPLYSSADTVQVESMIQTFLTDLQNKDYECAVGQLKELHGPSVKDLTETKHKELVKYYTQMPVLSYKLHQMTWNDRDFVNFIYDVEFFKKEPGQNIPNTYKISLTPIRINGVWYLTLGERNR